MMPVAPATRLDHRIMLWSDLRPQSERRGARPILAHGVVTRGTDNARTERTNVTDEQSPNRPRTSELDKDELPAPEELAVLKDKVIAVLDLLLSHGAEQVVVGQVVGSLRLAKEKLASDRAINAIVEVYAEIGKNGSLMLGQFIVETRFDELGRRYYVFTR